MDLHGTISTLNSESPMAVEPAQGFASRRLTTSRWPHRSRLHLTQRGLVQFRSTATQRLGGDESKLLQVKNRNDGPMKADSTPVTTKQPALKTIQ